MVGGGGGGGGGEGGGRPGPPPSLILKKGVICSLRKEPVMITKEASSDKFQMRFLKNV